MININNRPFSRYDSLLEFYYVDKNIMGHPRDKINANMLWENIGISSEIFKPIWLFSQPFFHIISNLRWRKIEINLLSKSDGKYLNPERWNAGILKPRTVCNCMEWRIIESVLQYGSI